MGSETFLEVILAIILPPVGVFLRYGCGVEFWICLLLTILGYIPGIIYALYVLDNPVCSSCFIALFLLRSAVFTSCQIITVCFSMKMAITPGYFSLESKITSTFL
ncbi:low temperature and salt responsive protein LTI6B [Populus alba x Populus x berolinensis]|uniref:Low temperature and salt responsive protein LTI6B n=1 Tax=Populus alba x Populus x berolinensis TaxID=444605 RepID=A0AAD6MMC8_9ROSI|nr:low temperature and salt responsive protein LTI6B [Populus alba x Populus x berolinensis]